MGVDVVDRRISQQAPNDGVRLTRLGQSRIGHHSISIEGAKRQDSPIQGRGNLVLKAGRLGRAFADEDRMCCPIGIGAIMRAMIDQKQSVARIGVVEGYAAGKSRLLVSGHPDGAVSRQLVITEADKMAEWSGVQA